VEAPPPLWRRAWIHAVGREFGPAIVLVLALPLLVAAWVASPASPWALHRADARVAAGDLDGAVEGYEQVRRWSALTDQRREATWRAASLSAGATAEPRRARRLYRAFLKDWPEDPRIASARVSLARLEWVDFGRPHRAARQFAWATRAAPESPEAAEWLHRSGEAWLEAGRVDQARAAWRRLVDDYPDEAAGAQLALARLALQEGRIERAFEDFQAVAVAVPRGPEATLARLGMSMALEQLGDLEAALAELDEVADELPHGVWQQRRERLIARRLATTGE